MSDWRWKQSNSTPKVFKDRSKISTTEPPFAVYPEYSKIPSREELAEQISNFLNDKGITFSKKSQGRCFYYKCSEICILQYDLVD